MDEYNTEQKKQQRAVEFYDTQIALTNLDEHLAKETEFFVNLKMNHEKLSKMSLEQSVRLLDRILRNLKKIHSVAHSFSLSHKKLFDFANELYGRLPNKKEEE